jgi:DNA-binding SARP family transcriptional activator
VAIRLDTRPTAEAQGAITPARLALLGGFELTIGERDVPLPFNAQRLLAFLAIQEHPLQRLFVAGTLWPDTPEIRSSGNLRSTLWRVHRLDADLIEASGQQLRLGTRVAVDARESAVLACRIIAGAALDERTDLEPLFVEGELLPDCYDDWVVAQRERVRQLRLQALETLCSVLTGQGRYGQAVQAGLAAVFGEPLRESAERALINAHLAQGNVAEALRRYRRFRRLLFDELAIEPTSMLEDLVRHLIH